VIKHPIIDEADSNQTAATTAVKKKRKGGRASLQLNEEEMKIEKDLLKQQYGHPPECNDFIIIYEKSKKFNK
jgi:hypothetical protein